MPNKAQQPTIAPKRAIAAERQRRWADLYLAQCMFIRPGDKRRLQLEESASELIRLVRRCAPIDRVVEAIEAVRQAALSYYRALGKQDCRKAHEWRARNQKEILVYCVRNHV